jgi:tetratricopeptide (TPR) repeat protein
MMKNISVCFYGNKHSIVKQTLSFVCNAFGYLFFIYCFLQSIPASSQKSEKADKLESSLKLENKPEQRAVILLSLSEELVDENPEKSLAFALEALRISEATDNQKEQLKTLAQIAQLYINKGDIKQALAYGQHAVDLAEKRKNTEELFKAHMIIGYVYDALGDYNRSIESFFHCLKLSEQLNDPKKKFRAYNGIGYSNFNLNNYQKALEYYQKALSISRDTKDTIGIACELNNISAVYGSLNDTQYIERYVREAVAINLKMNNLKWVSINYGNLAAYFLDRKDYDSAFAYIQKNLEIANRIQNPSLIASSIHQLANFYITTGKQEEGLKTALEAFDLAMKFGLKKQVYTTSLLLRDIYREKKDFLLAYRYDTLSYQMQDSLNLDVNSSNTTRLELQYELEKSLNEKRLTEQKRNATTIIILIVLIALIILVLLLFIRHRLKSKYFGLQKAKLEVELDFRNKELASNVMSLMKKNEIITEIIHRLLDVKQMAVKDETKTAIEKIANDLQNSMEKGIWDEFELRFRQVQKEFYDKLMHMYPDLSPNEQKLCAFLRLNMTNKEISELTGQSTKALETARYRLRIKFGLSNSHISLINYLSSI